MDGLGKETETKTHKGGGKSSDIPFAPELLPAEALLKVSKILAEGVPKYGRNNWKKIPSQIHLRHALTHIFALMADDEQDDHLGHAACRLLMALEVYDPNYRYTGEDK